MWHHILKHFNEIDFVVIGEGEFPFLSLVRCIDREDYEHLGEIRGIGYRDAGRIVRTEDSGLIEDLDTLPNPAGYFTYQHLSSTRGCPGRCTFCGSRRFWGRKVRFHSPSYFLEELQLLYRKGVSFFCFSDDTFSVDKERVIVICKKIVESNLNIAWAAISRVNYVSEEMLYWMRRAGCIQISYGIESGSERIRRLFRKDIKASQIKKAFALTTKYGILARVYFIYGSPLETWETIHLIHEIKPLSVVFYMLDLFPGTALYEDFKEKTASTDDMWLEGTYLLPEVSEIGSGSASHRELLPSPGRDPFFIRRRGLITA